MIKKIIKKLKESKIEILLILSFVICISSINSVPDDFFLFYYLKDKNFFNYFNFYRSIASMAIFFLLSIFFTLKKNINKLFLYFFFFEIWQILIFTIQNDSPLSYIMNYQLVLNSLSILLIFILADHYKVQLEKKILFILIIYISLISLFFFSKLILEFISNKDLLYLYKTEALQPESKNFEQATPRITGIARMFLIIFYFLFFFQININNKLLKIIALAILFFLILGIYSTQTRGGITGILIFIFYYFLFFREKFKEKIFNIFLIVLIPIMTFEGIIYFKKNFYNNLNKTALETKNIIDSRIVNNLSTSGRIEIWRTSLKVIKEKKIIFGYGPQADRLLLSEHQGKTILNNRTPIFDNNSSNALIYSYLCGGILSFIFFLVIYFLILKQIFLFLFIKREIIKKNPLINFSLITLIFLTARTAFENGYAVFGVDYLFCITCYVILIKYYKIKKNQYLFLRKFEILFFSTKKYFSLK
jgi:hypothetical protein